MAQLSGEDQSKDDLTAAISMLGLAARTCEPADVREEYFNLFIGLGRGELVPYGSWYQTGFLMEKPLGVLRDDLRTLDQARPTEQVASPEMTLGQLAPPRGPAAGGDNAQCIVAKLGVHPCPDRWYEQQDQAG